MNDNTNQRIKELEQALSDALHWIAKGIADNIYKDCSGNAENYYNHFNYILNKTGK